MKFQPTFDCLPDWLREIQEYANTKVLKILVGEWGVSLSCFSDPKLIDFILNFLGNKTDRDDREVPTAIGEEFARQHNMYYLETSAKQSDNVEKLFYEIASELIEQARNSKTPNRNDANGVTNLGNKTSFSHSNCCGGLNLNLNSNGNNT